MPDTTRTQPALARPKQSLVRNISFMLMWSSVAASGFGDRLIQLGAWEILGFSDPDAQRASIQAGVTLFFFLPFIVFGPIGGWLADTLPRKWLLLACDESRAAVLLLAVLLLYHYGYAGRGPVPADHPQAMTAYVCTYGIIFLTGLLAAIFSPTRDATVPQIVPLRQLQGANAIILAIATIASLIGIKAGDKVIEHQSVQVAIIIGFACYLISGWFFAFLRLAPLRQMAERRKTGQLERLMQAYHYVKKRPRLVQLYGLSLLFWGLSGVVMASLTAMAGRNYGITDPDSIRGAATTLLTMLGAGMLASSALMAVVSVVRESQWTLMLGVLVSGIALLAFFFTPVFWMAAVMAFFVGFASNIMRVSTDTLTQALSPNFIRGRVFGLREILTNTAIVVVNFIIWRMPNADPIMIGSIPWMSILLMAVGAWGFVYLITRGPLSPVSNALWRLTRLLSLAWHKIEWIGKGNVPASGPVILASNHTAGIDPFLIQGGMMRRVRWVMTRSYRFKALEFLWKRVDPIVLEADGKTSETRHVRQMLKALRDGDVLGMFPEGTLQRDVRELAPFREGVAMLARKTGATIVPIWISGTPATKKMIWHFLKPSRATVVFGKPFEVDPEASDAWIVEDLRRRMVKLAESLDRD